MKKLKACILGTGNIGSDLLMKVLRSEFVECSVFVGRNQQSKGVQLAKKLGIPVSLDSMETIEKNSDAFDIVFDATSAKPHSVHAPILKKLGKFTIDLTPARIGKLCIPAINLDQCLNEANVNLITCGGQAAVPIACAIMKAHPETEYIEVIASISSKSAGPGTRINIDEYTQATKDAILKFSGVPKAKAIIILNPAEPPITMQNTIYAEIKQPNIEKIKFEVNEMVEKIKKYVPEYELALEPTLDNERITTMVKVTGLGDFLPKYSGNLDIMTCAAVKLAEEYAKQKMVSLHEVTL